MFLVCQTCAKTCAKKLLEIASTSGERQVQTPASNIQTNFSESDGDHDKRKDGKEDETVTPGRRAEDLDGHNQLGCSKLIDTIIHGVSEQFRHKIGKVQPEDLLLRSSNFSPAGTSQETRLQAQKRELK